MRISLTLRQQQTIYFTLIEKAKVQNNTLHSHVPRGLRTQHIPCKLSLSRRQGQKRSSPISAVCIQTSCPGSTRMYVRSSYTNKGPQQGTQLRCRVGAQPRPSCLTDQKAGVRQPGCRLQLVGCLVTEAKKWPRERLLPLRRKKRGNRPARARKSNGVFGDGQIRTTGRKTVWQKDGPSMCLNYFCLLSNEGLHFTFQEALQQKEVRWEQRNHE